MGDPLEFTFDINPVPASRPRVGKWGTYYTGPYKVFKEDAIEIVQEALGYEFAPLEGPLLTCATFTVKRPKTTKLDYPRPDIDNYIKAVLDVLNGRLYVDDTQVVSIQADKEWAPAGEEGRIEFTCWEM